MPPSAALVLTNAIYFKDSWTAPFEDITDPEELVSYTYVDRQTTSGLT